MSDFFQSPSYVQWVRRLVSAMEGRADAVGLFDASMEEPGDLLRGAIERVLDEPGRPRLQSVLDTGNPLVIRTLAERYGVATSQVLCTTGALTGMSIVFEALAGPGDHVLIERPHLDTLVELAAATGAEVEFFRRDAADGAVDFDDLKARLRPDTRLVVITNLHNPSGGLLGEQDLHRLAALVDGRRTKIVVDEAYADYAHRLDGGRSATALSDAFIGVNSLSKVYGLGTLKCGWIVADHRTIAAIAPVHALREFGISKLTHAVASVVLEHEQPFADRVRAVLASGRPAIEAWADDLKREGLLEGDLPPVGCMYFPRLPQVEDARAFAEWLWRTHAVAVAPGELFQSPGHIRIGFGRPAERLAPALEHLGAALRSWRDDRRTPARALP